MNNALVALLSKCDALMEDINNAKAQHAVHDVQKHDLESTKEALDLVVELLQEMKEYVQNDATNYVQLWEARKEELRQINESQMSWIRTEIYRMMLEAPDDPEG